MRRPSLVVLLVCAVSLLTACQVSGPGKGSLPPSGANAVAGGPIEVTALDPVPGEAAKAEPVPDAAAAKGTETAAAQDDPKAAPVAEPVPEPAVEPVAEPADPAPKPDLTEIPVVAKSEKQLACEKKKGRWAKVGKGDVRACVYQTKDSGKRCERESQCDSVCLARSGTCAPFKPMYGCNEILQDNGARVTQCLD